MVICTLHLSKVLNRLEVVRSSENNFFDEKCQCAQKGVKVNIGTFAKTNKEIDIFFEQSIIYHSSLKYNLGVSHFILFTHICIELILYSLINKINSSNNVV